MVCALLQSRARNTTPQISRASSSVGGAHAATAHAATDWPTNRRAQPIDARQASYVRKPKFAVRALRPRRRVLFSLIMENFVNMGRQFLQNQQGGGGDAQGSNGDGLNINNIVSHAMNHNQQQGGEGQQQIFGQVASFLQHKQSNGQIDENVSEGELMNSFRKITQGGHGSSQEVGQAAAVGAFQHLFGQGGKSSGGTDALIGKALSLVQQHGGDSDAMHHASETVMKLVMKHKMQSMLGGGGGGNLSGLMSLLS